MRDISELKAYYHYSDICVVVENNGKVIYSNSNPDVREIIGGWKVGVEPIKIENPLGTLRYKLMVGSTTIYDSETILSRDYLVINSNGDEIKNNQWILR